MVTSAIFSEGLLVGGGEQKLALILVLPFGGDIECWQFLKPHVSGSEEQ